MCALEPLFSLLALHIGRMHETLALTFLQVMKLDNRTSPQYWIKTFRKKIALVTFKSDTKNSLENKNATNNSDYLPCGWCVHDGSGLERRKRERGN